MRFEISAVAWVLGGRGVRRAGHSRDRSRESSWTAARGRWIVLYLIFMMLQYADARDTLLALEVEGRNQVGRVDALR